MKIITLLKYTQATIAERQGASEDENFGAKLTLSKINFSSCLGIDRVWEKIAAWAAVRIC